MRLTSLLWAMAMIGLVLTWVALLRPQVLGGNAGYVMVTGSSMEPLLHRGDLVIVQRKGGYAVGDVVAYRVREDDPAAGHVVIHRIVGGSESQGFITRGDNTNGPDVWRPTPDEILGKVWLSLPLAARLLAFLRAPLPLASLAAGLTVFVVLGWEPTRPAIMKPSSPL
jgi:signal peptidase